MDGYLFDCMLAIANSHRKEPSMHANNRKKTVVDVLMLVGMFFSMSLQLFGPGVHKLIGLLTFLLFILHNVLNRQWYKGLFKGKYSPIRIAHTVTNFVVMLAMVGIMVSGVMLAKEMAQGLEGMTTGRILHNVCSYMECIGIAIHIGFHLKGRKCHDDR